MVETHAKDKLSFCGPLNRKCDKDGYDHRSRVRECNIILPNTSVSSKEVYLNVFKNMQTEKYSKLFNKVIEQKGNCEDIFFNKVYIETYNKKPVVVGPQRRGVEMTNLDFSQGFQQKPEHWSQRADFCKECFDYRCEMGGPNSVDRWFNL